jgi:hypothetical protein
LVSSKPVALLGTVLVVFSILIGLFYKQLVNFLLSHTTVEAVVLPYESGNSPFAGTILMCVPNQIWVGFLQTLICAAFVAGILLSFLFFAKYKK